MRKMFPVALSLAAMAIFAAGCAGPEQKLARGLVNTAEFARGGEMSRAVEESTVTGEDPDIGVTVGMIHGIDRSLARTAAGLYELATFPIPNHTGNDYGPIFRPAKTVYPESYRPNWPADSILSPDTSLGFGGGDIAPFMPGSRFFIFDGN